ncbi:MAG: hypothetical protein V1778_03775 [bacterium]
MKFSLLLPSTTTVQTALNRCGYATFRDPNTGETSYVRRFGQYFYPRFHLYVQAVTATEAQCSLHLDMKQPTYIRGHAHSGEYDGENVENEIRRILDVCASAEAGEQP